jgi:alkylglycerol monooxygenase
MQESMLIVYSIPVFFLLIGVELLVSRRQRRDTYNLPDSVSNIGCGIIDQVLGAFLGIGFVGVYAVIAERWALWELPPAAAWAVGLLGVDFIYYWFHRWSHEVNFMWAGHSVHHQSEEYNLTVSLRQGLLTRVTGGPLYLPLALVGVPVPVFLVSHAVMLLYQFWIHTRLIGKLGVLEHVVNTPSHHRVHHAVNPRYIDRNYGGTLMIWDRIFGTLAYEEEEPVYGTVKPLRSFNPLWAQLHPLVTLAQLSRDAAGWRDALRHWIAPPGWRPGQRPEPIPEVTPATRGKFRAPLSAREAAAVLLLALASLGAANIYLFGGPELPWALQAAAVGASMGALAWASAWVRVRPDPATSSGTSAARR